MRIDIIYNTPPTLKVNWGYQCEPVWWPTVKATLDDFLLLKEDWNSYGAAPIDPKSAAHALCFLVSTLDSDQAIPCIIPTVYGGIQIEQHFNNSDLEVAIGPEFASFYYEDDYIEYEKEYSIKDEWESIIGSWKQFSIMSGEARRRREASELDDELELKQEGKESCKKKKERRYYPI